MQDFRKVFFQVLLLILAIVFTAGIRYAATVKSTQAGSFGTVEQGNITVSDVFSRLCPEVKK